MNTKELARAIRSGEIDCNNQQPFFVYLVRALLSDLRDRISVRGTPVPHMILHTGDDVMWLLDKGYDWSIEPQEISNENYIYMTVPRCVIQTGSIDLLPDQLTSPYVSGMFQMENDGNIHTLAGDFRRMPLKMQVNLKYYVDSYRDSLEIIQQAISKLAFVRTYKFQYLGQVIRASYRIPDSWSDQHLAELTGNTTEDRNHTIEISLELESFMPVFSPSTVHEATRIAHPVHRNTIKDEKEHRAAHRDLSDLPGYRGPHHPRYNPTDSK